MQVSAILQFNIGNNEQLYELLESEEFDFTKEIEITTQKKQECVQVIVKAKNLHYLKIGTTAVIQSCDIIAKTLETVKQ